MPQRPALKNDLLRQHSVIRTQSPAAMRDILDTVYKARRFDVRPGGGDFFARAGRLQFQHIGFDYCAYEAEVELGFPAIGSLRQQICLSGGGETFVGGGRIPLSIEDTCVIPAGADVGVSLNAPYRQLVLRVDPDALRRKLEAIVGEPVARAPEFGRSANFRSPGLRSLRRLALFLADELDRQDSPLPPAALGEIEDAVLAAFVCGHQHDFSHLLAKGAPPPSPRQVRMAEAFIEAHWGEPLTVEAISQAVGVSARSLFRAFKQSRGHSPMEFLKETRLRQARAMLSRPEGALTVMEVAFTCGFQSHGHFARDYRLLFGETPSATFSRARSR